jgi:histidine triad (HIT) family protein
MAFLDIQPINPGHVLVIPKYHAESMENLPEEDAAHMMRVGQIVDKALRRSELRCEGVNMVIADGRAAGQDVDHIHLHVFPRFKDDGFEINIQSGSRKPPGREQLDETAGKLKQALRMVV